MNYLKFEFEIENDVENEILIALLSNAGFESFEEERKMLKAFISEKDLNEDELSEILKIVPVKYTQILIPPQNWNAEWESSFEPVIVDGFVAVRAGFHTPVKNVQHEIIITPKMSFGTGHHATTYLMMGQMAELDIAGKTVLDFGTGTAVLAILAEKMGAAKIDAIDNDDWSIENAGENIKANDCSKIAIHKGETVSLNNTYDIVLANINLNVILANLDAIAAVSKTGTHVLLSGFLKGDEAVFFEKLSGYKFSHLKTVQKGEWICMLIRVD
ncbi:MAG TPA: 50S ribosomal protein L11 methyltransferase [Ferruginibacter sp.]|nr:50S ribosomal protein L11 methyltransferase [Ferruginibacter sp.]